MSEVFSGPVAGLTALTLWPEWLPCFTHLDKRVENRTWPPPARLLGQDLVLHAGKSIGGGKVRKGLTRVQGMARAAGWELEGQGGRSPSLRLRARRRETGWEPYERTLPIPRGFAVCVVHLDSADELDRTPWDVPGMWHWRVSNVRLIEPAIAISGRQGLWRMPE